MSTRWNQSADRTASDILTNKSDSPAFLLISFKLGIINFFLYSCIHLGQVFIVIKWSFMSRAMTAMLTPVHSVSVLPLVIKLTITLCKLIFICVLFIPRGFFVTFINWFIHQFIQGCVLRSSLSSFSVQIRLCFILVFHRFSLRDCTWWVKH